jgi:hypothetical protein
VRFFKTADLVVTRKGFAGHFNLGLGVYDDRGELVEIGQTVAAAGDWPKVQVGGRGGGRVHGPHTDRAAGRDEGAEAEDVQGAEGMHHGQIRGRGHRFDRGVVEGGRKGGDKMGDQPMAWCEKCDHMVPVQGERKLYLARLAIALLLLPFTLFLSIFLVKKIEPYRCARCGSQLGFRTGPKTMPGATYFKPPITDVLGGALIGFIIAVVVIVAVGPHVPLATSPGTSVPRAWPATASFKRWSSFSSSLSPLASSAFMHPYWFNDLYQVAGATSKVLGHFVDRLALGPAPSGARPPCARPARGCGAVVSPGCASLPQSWGVGLSSATGHIRGSRHTGSAVPCFCQAPHALWATKPPLALTSTGIRPVSSPTKPFGPRSRKAMKQYSSWPVRMILPA